MIHQHHIAARLWVALVLVLDLLRWMLTHRQLGSQLGRLHDSYLVDRGSLARCLNERPKVTCVIVITVLD